MNKYKVGDTVKFTNNGTKQGTIKSTNYGWTPFSTDRITYNIIDSEAEYQYIAEDSIIEKIN